MDSRTDRHPASVPCGVSHIAVVTGDLDGYGTFSEDVIGLETTLVLGAGPGHRRQAVLAAGGGHALHVFELPGYNPTVHGFGPTMFERGRLDHLGFTVTTVAALTTLRDRLLAVDASSGAIRRVGPTLSVRFHDPDDSEGEVNCLDPSYDPSTLATRTTSSIRCGSPGWRPSCTPVRPPMPGTSVITHRHEPLRSRPALHRRDR